MKTIIIILILALGSYINETPSSYPFNFPYKYHLKHETVDDNLYYKTTTYRVKLESEEQLTITYSLLLNNKLYMTAKAKIKAIKLIKENSKGKVISQTAGIEKTTNYEYFKYKSKHKNNITESKIIFRRNDFLLMVRKCKSGKKTVFNLDSIYHINQ